jgi:recombination protein RecA
MRAVLESLLRARKLDTTLTTADPWSVGPAERIAATGWSELDATLDGGLRRGHLSEIVGPSSSGRSTLVDHLLAAATLRGEIAALIDTCDSFDPVSAAALGIDLTRVLWVRERGDATRALKAFSLILQAGGFGVVVLDLADVSAAAIRRFPWTTWFRIARTIEGGDTVAVLVGAHRLARSTAGVTIALGGSAGRWIGQVHRERLFAGVTPVPRIVSAR